MKLTEEHLKILKGKLCPYCKSKTKIIPANKFYDKTVNIDFVVTCRNYPNCKSYTNAIPGSTEPKGRLANGKLLRCRSKAYYCFNKLIDRKLMQLEQAYAELSEYLGIPLRWCEISYMNIKNCLKTETWAIKKLIHFEYKKTGRFVVPMTVRNGKRKKITIIEQVDAYNTIVEFEEDEKRMQINSEKIFFYNTKKK